MSDSSSATSLQNVLQQARLLMQSRRWKEALNVLEGPLNSTDQLIQSGDPVTRVTLSQIQLFRANVLRDFRQPGAVEGYQAATRLLSDLSTRDDETTNLLANVWTNQGITLLEGPEAEKVKQSLACFDQAISLRESLPLDQSPLFSWGLAASWMNRADALMRLDPKTNQPDALISHEKALQVLNLMPEGSHPSLPARRALAIMNCALLALDGSRERLEAAATKLAEAIEICQSAPPVSAQECLRVRIGIQLNRSILLLQTQPKQSWLDARSVLEITAAIEKQEILTAEAALKARHLLCQSLTLLSPEDMVDDWISEATDAVDDGLALVRDWPPVERQALMGLGYELFRFGLLIYRIWQPHFLSEFILENLDSEHLPEGMAGDPILHQLALEAIWSSVVDVNQRINQAGHEERRRLLPIIEELQKTEQRLQALRETHVGSQTPSSITVSSAGAARSTLNAL